MVAAVAAEKPTAAADGSVRGRVQYTAADYKQGHTAVDTTPLDPGPESRSKADAVAAAAQAAPPPTGPALRGFGNLSFDPFFGLAHASRTPTSVRAPDSG